MRRTLKHVKKLSAVSFWFLHPRFTCGIMHASYCHLVVLKIKDIRVEVGPLFENQPMSEIFHQDFSRKCPENWKAPLDVLIEQNIKPIPALKVAVNAE